MIPVGDGFDKSMPAIRGGAAVRPQGPPDWPVEDWDVLEMLKRAYADGSWGKYHGPWCRRLEEQLAAYHGVPHVMLCCSGTFAVELALRGLGVGAGDEVVMAGYDFAGNFQSILAVGARPVLVDVDAKSAQLDPEQLEGAVGPETRAIIASHLHGACVPMDRVMQFAERHGLKVVEDAAQMPGAMVEGRKVGTWGDVGVFSFGGSKLLSAGRGGATITRHAEVHQRAKVFCNRGNHAFPLSELQAAVLLPQLAKLDGRNAIRHINATGLVERLRRHAGLEPLALPTEDTQPGYYKLGFCYHAEAFGAMSRDAWTAAMRAEGIAFDAGFRTLAARSGSRCRKVGDLSHARHWQDCMVLLHHPILLGTEEDLSEIALALRKLLR